jgi:hypothetical protein
MIAHALFDGRIFYMRRAFMGGGAVSLSIDFLVGHTKQARTQRRYLGRRKRSWFFSSIMSRGGRSINCREASWRRFTSQRPTL